MEMSYFVWFGIIVGFIVSMIILVSLIFRKVVPTNMVHIIQANGSTIPYGRGKPAGNTYYQYPSWMPFIGVTVTQFKESIFQVSLDGYEAYDSNRLPFMVDISSFFRVENAETAAQRVENFAELNKQLGDLLRGSVRRILATATLEDIMQERATYGAQFTQELEAQIKEWGVTPVKAIEFMDIRDANGSRVIAEIMAKEQSRINMDSRIQVANNNKSAELEEINAQRTIEVQNQDALQQVGLRTAEKNKTVGIADEKVKQEIQIQAKTTAETNMEVLKVNEVKSAEIRKDVAKVEAEQEQLVKTISATADKEVKTITATADKSVQVVIADGNLEASKKDAEGITLLGAAKASAEKAMLMAPIDTQITLAKEIGENDGYQKYLINIKQIEISGNVGIQLAKAMETADLKIIANSGDVQSGMNSIGDIFTSKAGMGLSALMEGLASTDAGSALIEKFTSVPSETPKKAVQKTTKVISAT